MQDKNQHDKTSTLTPADLVGQYTFADNTLTRADGKQYKVCQQFNRQKHTPRLYLANDAEGYISGLFYDRSNIYNLSVKGYKQDRLQLVMTSPTTATIKPFEKVELLQFKGAKC